MRILGIDPGLATTGWSIVDFIDNKRFSLIDFGVISTPAGVANPLRLGEIYKDLGEIIKEFKPEIASLELLLFTNNAKTVMAVGEARGVILLALSQSGLPIYQFSPPQVKSSITGSGRANKRQVQENVKRIFGLESIPKPDDAADAIAIAVCCFDHLKMDKLLKM